jgi:hypothetical protein
MAPRPAICKAYSAGAVGAVRYHRETALRAPQFRFGNLAVTDASPYDPSPQMTTALDQPRPSMATVTSGELSSS